MENSKVGSLFAVFELRSQNMRSFDLIEGNMLMLAVFLKYQ